MRLGRSVLIAGGVVVSLGVLAGCATNNPLTLTSVQSSDAGSYSVTLSNAAGMTTSSNAGLTVFAPSRFIDVARVNR